MRTELGDRFWSKVDKTDDCWLWTGYIDGQGYGQFHHDGRVGYAHRVAYEALVGPIPSGLHIDHLCRVTACVRPSHLEPVTQAENLRRQGAAITHCPQGHEYTGDKRPALSGVERLPAPQVQGVCPGTRSSLPRQPKGSLMTDPTRPVRDQDPEDELLLFLGRRVRELTAERDALRATVAAPDPDEDDESRVHNLATALHRATCYRPEVCDFEPAQFDLMNARAALAWFSEQAAPAAQGVPLTEDPACAACGRVGEHAPSCGLSIGVHGRRPLTEDPQR